MTLIVNMFMLDVDVWLIEIVSDSQGARDGTNGLECVLKETVEGKTSNDNESTYRYGLDVLITI